MLPLRFAKLWLAGGWLLVMLSIVGSLAPSKAVAISLLNDKLVHFCVYLVMAVWFAGIYRRGRYVWIALGLIALGVLLEILQAAIAPSRSGDVFDLAANAAGIALGLLLALAGIGGWCGRVESWLPAVRRDRSRDR